MYVRHNRRNLSVELLRNIPLFAACTDKELERIARLTTETHVQAGRTLTHMSQPGSEFFIIVSGTATVWRGDTALDMLGPGSFFGEMSLFNNDLRTATVVADTEMRLLVMSRSEFFNAHFLVCSVMERMLAEISRRLRRADHEWVASGREERASVLV